MNRFVLKVIVFTIASASLALATQKQQSGKKDLVLTPLVGKECTVYLNNGEEVSGTFWDFGDDFVTVKVKKGLLYSKAEQYSVSEIREFEGPSGKKYDLQSLMGVDLQESRSDHENILRILTIKDDSEAPAEQPAEPTTSEVSKPEPKQPKPAPKPAASSVAQSTEAQQTKTRSPEPQVAAKPKAVSPEKTRAAGKDERKGEKLIEPTNAEETPNIPVAVAPTNNFLAAEKLRYQTMILAISAAVLFVLFVIFKGLGYNSLILAKYSMFPTRLIRMNGPYGIIDQGKEDGVKTDDIVRLYRKNGAKIEYKGRVRVTKVAQNYSAVETIRTQKDVKLGAGDVGIRDRNVLLNIIKAIRFGIGAALAATARGLAIMARRLSGEQQDPFPERKPRIVEVEHESDIKEVTEFAQKFRTGESVEDEEESGNSEEHSVKVKK